MATIIVIAASSANTMCLIGDLLFLQVTPSPHIRSTFRATAADNDAVVGILVIPRGSLEVPGLRVVPLGTRPGCKPHAAYVAALNIKE